MEFRILGPLEVIEDGQALDLGGRKQRTLLAVLLLHANEVVSSDSLIEALWPERPPETAPKALQVHVSQLRKILGRQRLRTKPSGYLLCVEDGELDLDRCRSLAGESRPAAALALWRGSSLSDFAYEPFAQTEIARLEGLRLACLEDRVEIDLAEGRHSTLVGELEALITEYPLRERFRGQLMLALYRSDRQAEALEVYQDGRQMLDEELGLEPSAALKELQRRILAHDPALDLPSPAVDGPVVEPAAPPSHADTRDAREVRKTVSVLVASLQPSDGAESMDPEALRRLVTRGFADIRAAVEHHGGTIETLAGETLTAVFGVPAVHEDDALRALRAAAEVHERLQSAQDDPGGVWAERLDVRLGLSTGEVVTGGPTHDLRSTGRPITFATRLGQAAGAGELLLDDATHRLVRDAATVERDGESLRFVSLRSGTEPTGRRLDAPMVGRERERRRLHDAFEQAVGDRSCQLFTILGAAGVGKSRLVQEFIGELGSTVTVVSGRCLPYGKGITYFPLMEAVRDAADLEDTDSPEEGLAKVAALLDDEGDADLLARWVGELVGLAEVGVGAHESFAAVRALFESVARRTPLVIVFDDIHWGEATFLDLIEHLTDWTREAPILVICVARPELLEVRPGWSGGKLNATSVLLEPLSEQECAELVDSLAGTDRLSQNTRTRIVDAAEGNPLFVEEMLALVLETGQPDAEVEVPPTIQALLGARLDRLDADGRAVLEHASVQGKEFYEAALVELLSKPLGRRAAEVLGSLVRKELIRPDRTGLGGRTYRFRHLLIRDAAYESIPKGARAEMHEQFGRWLERVSGERATEYEEVVGYHLEQAVRYHGELGSLDDAGHAIAREAAERLGAAGRRAFIRSDGPAGVNLISRAVRLLPPDDPLRVQLVPNVRVVQGLGGDLSWADRVLTEAVEAAATAGDRRLASHALVQRGLLRLFTEPEVTPDELIDVARRCVVVFEEFRDELGLARAWRLEAQAHYLARRGEACAAASERALEHIRRAGDRFEEQEIVEWLVIALLLGPAPADEAAERCRELLRQASEPLVEAEILAALAPLEAMQGNVGEAVEIIGRIRGTAGEWIWLVSFWWAFISIWQDDPAEAERELRPAYDALKRIGEQSHFSSMAHALSNAVYAQGRYEEAEALTQECERASRANDVHSQIAWRSVRAKTLARRGALDEAERLAREAVAFAETSDFLLGHADALTDLAEVLELRGERVATAAALSEAVALHERKGNQLVAGRTRAVLEKLAAAGD